jgi:5-methylcytosine-specific restriction endonuclease McrA
MPAMPPRHRPAGWRPAVKRTDPFYQSRGWQQTRAYVLRRDGGVCQRCGLPGADTAHHIIERKDGGSDDPPNLEAIHRRCHNRAHPTKGGSHD